MLQEGTRDYKRLKRVTRDKGGYKGLQKFTRDYKSLHVVTRG